MTKENMVTLEVAKKEELDKFKRDLQESFGQGIIDNFGDISEGPIPEDKDIEDSFNAKGSKIYHIVSNGKKVGGVVLNINEETQHNSLDLFFICKDEIGMGFGYKAWKAIEEKYPETKVWETCTPYFERRNIHFYVNKCGFKIVEVYNKYNPEPHMPEGEGMPGDEDFFRFEKIRSLEMSIDEIREAKDELVRISNDKEQREIYEMRAKILKDKVSALNEAERKGMEKGREKGIKEGEKKKAIEIARNLLDVLDNETISIKTGLTVTEIENLR